MLVSGFLPNPGGSIVHTIFRSVFPLVIATIFAMLAAGKVAVEIIRRQLNNLANSYQKLNDPERAQDLFRVRDILGPVDV